MGDDRDGQALLLLQEEDGLPLRVVLIDGGEDASQEPRLHLRLRRAEVVLAILTAIGQSPGERSVDQTFPTWADFPTPQLGELVRALV